MSRAQLFVCLLAKLSLRSCSRSEEEPSASGSTLPDQACLGWRGAYLSLLTHFQGMASKDGRLPSSEEISGGTLHKVLYGFGSL